jgi:tetratricopeptide (TPR) repeat protein
MADNRTSGSQWQIMLPNGRIIGPYTTSVILKMLSDNSLSGEEKIRKIGANPKWIPFSKSIEFYDKLMELALTDKREKKTKEPLVDVMAQETILERPSAIINKARAEIEEHQADTGKTTSKDADKTQVIDQEPKTTAVTHLVTHHNSLMSNKTVKLEIGPTEPQALSSVEVETSKNQGEVVDLAPIKDLEREIQEEGKSKKIIGLFILCASLLLIYLSFDFFTDSSGSLRLVAPSYGKGTPLSPEEAGKIFQQGLFLYQKDGFEFYQEAQFLFVKLIEAQGSNLRARAFLCLTYRELWPYVTQDSKDQETFTNLVKSTKAMDPTGEFGVTCEISRLMAFGKVNEARGIIDYFLEQTANSNNPIFIALKAEVLGRSLEYSNAILFLDTAQKISPNWARLYSLKGQYEILDGQKEPALKSFRDAIKINPKHKIAFLNIGIIEYRFQKNLEAAIEALTTGFQISSRAPRSLEVKGYKTLAQIFKEKRDFDRAKSYIEMAYALQPRDQEIKNLLIELGGDAGTSKINMNTSELVYLGDQYVNLGDCLAAQAEYKAAFEIDPKNSIAALKAGKCLWQLAQPSEAIEWLKKAIRADPKLIEGYVLLADFYSQRYDFNAASEILAVAARKNPNNSEVFKGYGIIEFRRNNLKAALGYLNRSLKVFDNDESVLILIAKANAGLGNFDQAQNFAIRALEIDPTNAEAMVVYGKNLVQYKGASAGLNYLNEQIKKFAYTIELRLGLAEVYLELERYSEAERIYGQIVDFNPKSRKGWIGLGKSYQAQLRYSDSIRAFIEAGILDVSDAEPLFLLGRLYLDINQIDKAISHFEKAIKANPNFPNLYYQIGRAALMKGDLKLALEYALKERQKNPNIVESYLLAAEVYDINQEYQLCASEYQKALKLVPQGANIHVKMARCYRLAGAIDIAENMLNVAASIESGLPEIYREQGAIFESKMDFRAAVTSYEKYLMLSPNAKDKRQVERKILQLQK